MKKISVKALVIMAMFAAVISVLSIIQIPTPWGVPFTLQTFSISLCAYVLGKKYGTCSTIIYILLGTVGVPVFSGLKSGPAVLAGPTGGYLFGFIIMAFLCGLAMELYYSEKGMIKAIVISLLGLLLCHLVGVIRLKYVLEMSFAKAALLGSASYIVKDIISLVIAFYLAISIRKSLLKAGLLDWDTKYSNK